MTEGKYRREIQALTKQMVPLVLVVMLLVFSIFIPNFCSVGNMVNILSSFSVYGVVTLAMAYAMICGEFDLSVGSTMALASLIFAKVVNDNCFLLALLIALLAGAIIGAMNGFLVSKFNIPSFVVTMGMQITVKGAACFYTREFQK